MSPRGTVRVVRAVRTQGQAWWLGRLLGVILALALLSLPSAGKPAPGSDAPGSASEPAGSDSREAAGQDNRSAASPAGKGGTTSTTTTPEPREVTLVATGDTLLHGPLWDQAAEDAAADGRAGYDFAPLMAGIEPLVSEADLAICHLETPLAPPGGPFSGYPVFSVPPEIAPALAETGYDACSTAANHSYDQGADGVDRTLDTLDAAGIDHAGTARSEAEANELTMVDVGNVAVALLSYSYSFNGIPAPNGEEWRANPIDETAILADAATARADGADLVVVSMHWGDEYNSEPNAQQTELAPRLIGSDDIDLLLGHHAHVVQPIELLDGGWVVYGMGNAVANQATLGPEKAEGLLVRFTFTEDPAERSWDVTAAEYAPLLLDREPWPRRLVVVADALADPGANGSPTERLQAAWDRTNQAVLSRGADQHGLTAIGP